MFRLVFRRQSGERFDCTDYSLKVADSKMRNDSKIFGMTRSGCGWQLKICCHMYQPEPCS